MIIATTSAIPSRITARISGDMPLWLLFWLSCIGPLGFSRLGDGVSIEPPVPIFGIAGAGAEPGFRIAGAEREFGFGIAGAGAEPGFGMNGAEPGFGIDGARAEPGFGIGSGGAEPGFGMTRSGTGVNLEAGATVGTSMGVYVVGSGTTTVVVDSALWSTRPLTSTPRSNERMGMKKSRSVVRVKFSMNNCLIF